MPERAAPKFFRDAASFRTWLEQHHGRSGVLWVGYFRKGADRPSVTYPESVDEALCFGWIDGIRQKVDDARYMVRFTPRRPGSLWSQVNTRRARALIRRKRMRPAGLAAFRAQKGAGSPAAPQGRTVAEAARPYLRRLRAKRKAWEFFRHQPPFYQRTTMAWIVSARKEETRLRRLGKLMESCARGARLI
jgi:uncharacterized protein YdeI (YjbR/CyaY-like superfamily)